MRLHHPPSISLSCNVPSFAMEFLHQLTDVLHKVPWGGTQPEPASRGSTQTAARRCGMRVTVYVYKQMGSQMGQLLSNL
jgi:hypothetical protein